MIAERPGTPELGQNYRNYSRTILFPGPVEILHQFQDPGHVRMIGVRHVENILSVVMF